MAEQMKVRLWAECVMRIPLDTTINVDEFREWYEESGAVFDPHDIDTDALVQFIHAGPDCGDDTKAQFPEPDTSDHEVMTYDITEADLLAESENGNE